MATKRNFLQGNSPDAIRLRTQEAERDALIKALGMAPEDKTSAGSRYAATTGELAVWLRQEGVRS